jgi:regulator of sigma E protease
MILDIAKGALRVVEVLVIFNLLIIVHELGHFLAARWRGLHVEKFGVWFGKPLWRRKIGGVEYSLGCIPAGGFVLLPQMAPMEAIEGKGDASRDELPPIKPIDKIIVAFAGPLFSFLLAIVFATIVWVVGRPLSEAETTTTVGYVLPNEPAAQAGFKPGDKILEVDGHPVTRFNGIVDSIMWYVMSSEGETIPFKIERDGKELTLQCHYDKPETNSWARKPLRQVGLAAAFTPIVAKVTPNSPAAATGLLPDDEIVAVGGEKLYHPQQLTDWAQAHPGEKLQLTVIRNGKTLTIGLEPGTLQIDGVIKNSPADVAGLKKGDTILEANGEPVHSATAVISMIDSHPDQPLTLVVQRGAEKLVKRVLPAAPDGSNHRIVGFTLNYADGIYFDGGGKLTIAHTSPLEQVTASVQTMTNTVGALLSPHSDIKLQHMSGPIMIMRTYFVLLQSDFGFQLALWFSVVFNVNLALINLLPIPVLDGGHIVLALFEMVRRRPLNIRVLEVVQGACVVLLIGFMLYISFYDAQDLSGSGMPKFSVPAKEAPPAK